MEAPQEGGKREATLEDCLELLRTPSDEKRFVALLLLSKLLKVLFFSLCLGLCSTRICEHLLRAASAFRGKVQPGCCAVEESLYTRGQSHMKSFSEPPLIEGIEGLR